MIMLDTLRTLAGIRKERRLPPPGAHPQTGSNIVFDSLRIHLKHPITVEQWVWLAERGWRTIDMRTNRRQYLKVDEQLVFRLIMADEIEERERIYERIIATTPNPPVERNILQRPRA